MPTYAYKQTYVLYKLYCMCKYEYGNIDVLAQYSLEDTLCTGNFSKFFVTLHSEIKARIGLYLCNYRLKNPYIQLILEFFNACMSSFFVISQDTVIAHC